MRPGPARGSTHTLEVTITRDMTARVAGEEIHPVYGTVALVEHIEQVCREMLVPHLEPGEEGVGYSVEAMHRAPVTVGTRLVFTATVARVGPKQLVCEILVRDGGRIVARGSMEQRVVDADEFEAQVRSSGAAATSAG